LVGLLHRLSKILSMAKLYILKILICFLLLTPGAAKAGLVIEPPVAEVKIFPNPAQEHLYYKTESTSAVEFEIYSLIGNKQVFRVQKTEEGLYRLEIGHLQPGTYFLSSSEKDENQKFSFRFHKK